jgi:hypothetical protein
MAMVLQVLHQTLVMVFLMEAVWMDIMEILMVMVLHQIPVTVFLMEVAWMDKMETTVTMVIQGNS